MKITALIPARLNSSRFNGKLMMDLCGKPVITRTYDAVLSSNLFSSVIGIPGPVTTSASYCINV